MPWTLTPDRVHPALLVGGPPAANRVTLPGASFAGPDGGPPSDPAAGVLDGLLTGLLRAADADPAVGRWRELRGQLDAAATRGRAAANRVTAADAAEALLKTDPVPGLAAELKRVAGERDRAAADGAAAADELAVLRPLAPGLWRAAVWAVEGHWHEAAAARQAELNAAAESAGEVASKAVTAAVAGLAGPLEALYAARRRADRLLELRAGGSPARAAALGPEPLKGG